MIPDLFGTPEGDEADRLTDPGPDRMRQERIPGAGWVRYEERPMPAFVLPPQSRTTLTCDDCLRQTPTWTRVESSWRGVGLIVCPACLRRRQRGRR
jgi:hypothetical protein